jgi:hypothetical protein
VAADEGRASQARAVELRHRCDDLERQLAKAQAALQAGTPPGVCMGKGKNGRKNDSGVFGVNGKEKILHCRTSAPSLPFVLLFFIHLFFCLRCHIGAYRAA